LTRDRPPADSQTADTFLSAKNNPETLDRIGSRLTPLRCRVLEVLEEVDRPIGAYELMTRLVAMSGRRHAPPTVYRALDFLLEQHLAIRVESLNAFVAAAHSASAISTIFFICNICGAAKQIQSPRLQRVIDEDAAILGFHVSKRVVELHGLCARCHTKGGGQVSPLAKCPSLHRPLAGI
jgi:Fur family transcriptional regulator, zinc uptake regulator